MSGLQIRTVVFPTDFSECSEHAAKRAAEVARHFRARVHVVHVDGPVAPPTPAARLAAAAADLGPDLDVTTAMTSGVPAHAICAYAQRIGADLIVMGTHGRTGVSRAVLGSVAEAVVRHARCPVMTMPALEVMRAEVTTAPTGAGRCVGCAKPSLDLICASCRAIIRGAAVETTRAKEQPARLASPR